MPLNRLVAFIIKPIVSTLVAVVAAWLATHFPGLQIPDAAETANAIAQAAGFIVGGYATSKGFDKWIEGWIKFEENETMKELASQAPVVPPGLDVPPPPSA